ncbi:hypothetical protein A1D22_00740 [Pasteurellaceae bacterium LFhippo2]|nr:hypothetical protein [Pasteurellaceae bacterium LFhippo2]
MKKETLFQKREQRNAFYAKMQEIFKLDLTIRTNSPYADPNGRRKPLGNYHQANNCTPFLTRAFFIRSLRTPKENCPSSDLSMVACSGKGIALCCFPCIAVCHPVTSYRPITVTSEAVALINLYKELSAMIYLFLCVNRNSDTYQETIERIEADSEQNARFKLHADLRPILAHPIARINPNRTACTAQGGVYA